MSRTQVFGWALIFALLSGVLLTYLITFVSPFLSDTQLNSPAIILFFLGLFMFVASIGTLIALRLHMKWPRLGGLNHGQIEPFIAVRQGLLTSTATVLNCVMAFWRVFDIVFVLVLFLLAGLFEVFLQSREQSSI